ncbi:transcriptional regulator [Micromonospora sp. CPCC 205371]|nr:transcriptional regulator [Micromonospora sp. CPCC 205371]
MTHASPTGLLVLHGVRLKGHAETGAVAARFGLDTHDTNEYLLDAQAHGWVTKSSFADLTGWSLTGTGRQRNESQLREELDSVGARAAVDAVHEEFLPFNARAARLFTAAQLDRPDDVHSQLADVADALRLLEGRLAAHLTRFAGYHARFAGALAQAIDHPVWITGIEVDSCHRVWFELHEDLIATLGISR